MTSRILSTIFILSTMLLSSPSNAITPVFSVNKEINFGLTLFVSGDCEMHHLTGQFISTAPSVMCGSNGPGTPGYYVIIANPNKQIRFRIYQRNNLGDGVMFIPSGELISDSETVAITANTLHQIDSGTSGVVHIRIGGRLFVVNQQAPSQSFDIEKVDGIEWSELP